MFGNMNGKWLLTIGPLSRPNLRKKESMEFLYFFQMFLVNGSHDNRSRDHSRAQRRSAKNPRYTGHDLKYLVCSRGPFLTESSPSTTTIRSEFSPGKVIRAACQEI